MVAFLLAILIVTEIFSVYEAKAIEKATEDGDPQFPTLFRLYVDKNTEEPEFLRNTDDFDISSTSYDCQKNTKFVIHGYMSSPDIDWAVAMRAAMLEHLKANVIFVDWSVGASDDSISKAIVNGLDTAQQTADLIVKLQKETCTDWGKVHVIGHSLGAQVAGFVGKYTGGNIGRITGLEPGAPAFEDAPPEKRLDKSDARFVDVIHTNSRITNTTVDSKAEPDCPTGVSLPALLGHLDFFPNGGHQQPGCPGMPCIEFNEKSYNETFGWMTEEQYNGYWCSHQRAPALFSASMGVSPEKFLALSCESYDSYLEGKCNTCSEEWPCAVMGIQAEKYRPTGESTQGVKYFLTTSDKPPYVY